VVLPVLVTELELGAASLEQRPFPLVELGAVPYAEGTPVITALVDRYFFPLLPPKEGMLAVRAIVPGPFAFTEPFLHGEKLPADLAEKLGAPLPVIVVEVRMGSIAARATRSIRYLRRTRPISYGSQRFAVRCLVGSQKFPVVFRRGRWLRHPLRFDERSEGIDRKIPVLGILLFEVVFWFHLWIAVGKHFNEAAHNLLNFALRELGADPDDETGYFGHRMLASGYGLAHYI
jgi:hypothetical protein